jgi:hypothetical protein
MINPRDLPGNDGSEDGRDVGREDGREVDAIEDRATAASTETGASADATGSEAPNPPRTTTFGWLTAPKFGSAGSGGLELEPGPEAD